jgi:TolB protein
VIVLATNGIGGNADLFVMRPDGSHMHAITRTKVWDSAPDWGPSKEGRA